MSQEKYMANNNLKELHGSGYEIMDGEPDIRGWKVKTQTQEIGKVEELLFDTMSQKVRYLIVDLNGKPLNLLSRNILIPIGLAELDRDNKLVLFPEVTVGHLATLPEYKKGTVTLQTERSIRTVFLPAQNTGLNPGSYQEEVLDDSQFYNHEHFNDERMYRSRGTLAGNDADVKVERGGSGSITPSRRNEENVQNRQDDEQQGNSGTTVQSGSFAPFQEGVIEIKEHSEVPVVSKQTRIVEEISLNKEVTEHDERVRDSVRETEVDVERLKKNDSPGPVAR